MRTNQHGSRHQDDKVKLTHHLAIVEYLARRHGLWPDTEDGVTEATVLREVARDLTDMSIDYMYFKEHRVKVWRDMVKQTEEIVNLLL